MNSFALSQSGRQPVISQNPLGFAATATSRVRRWIRVRADRRRLQALPDYLLRDMGLSRGEIEDAVAGGREALRPIPHPYY